MSDWIFSVIYLSVFCSVAMLVTPEGAAKKTVGLVCSAAMIIAVISPLHDIDLSNLSLDLQRYKNEADKLCSAAADEEENLNRTFIEDKCKTYIMDKTTCLGAEISSITVNAQWSTDGFWYPQSAIIEGKFTHEQKTRLEAYMEAELGILKSDQTWG